MDAIEDIEGLEGFGDEDDEDVVVDTSGLDALLDGSSTDILSGVAPPPPAVPQLDFPEKFQSMKLGEITRRLRIGDVFASHDSESRVALDAIGFDWGPPDKLIAAPFARVLCGLYAYKKIRGDLCVDLDFEVPAYDPWPSVLGGAELGRWVNELRGQKELMEEEYPLKYMMLNQLQFLWLSKIL